MLILLVVYVAHSYYDVCLGDGSFGEFGGWAKAVSIVFMLYLFCLF